MFSPSTLLRHQHGRRDVKLAMKFSRATSRVSNGNTFYSRQELPDHLPLHDPPRMIVAFAWDLGKSREGNFG